MKKIIFIPGLLGNEALWQPLLHEFKNNYDIQILNVSTCEDIGKFAQQYSLTIQQDVILIGFSMGAWIALSMYFGMAKYCNKLILISSAPGHLKHSTKELFSGYIQQITQGEFETFINKDYEVDVSPENKTNPHLKRQLCAMMRKEGPQVAIKQLKALMHCENQFNRLNEVSCPTLLIRGEKDKNINIQRQALMLAEIPKAEIRIIPNSAHYVPLENPEILASVMENWLEGS
ncbi:alpha/beta fold hydrolase [Legionella jordanis]|uniref:Lipolytic protein n=1 Tax=Legionella jordanis TaxID=456 RepID=A0A0W0VE69_9GAMM|nr:alpha/beta hydrolase [Legionella jordanis]KTD18383.1 lipolytic protein [Legionella jordanis]RMX05292.1 alpha/beta hydrolase [Legionella jordanis]RMX20857.1 alpha/beta hydrolase [Legionella jordanis]VEH13271.1 lipolytic protein [Legionella jordanis]HAT8713619.1 alpha/beta fold hydrolase [Legionella jordanis]